MTTQLMYSLEFNKHNTPGHPENAQRLTTLIHHLKNASFYEKLKISEPTPLSETLLSEIHGKDMIEQIKTISNTGDSWIDLDTYVCKDDYHTALLAAGSVHDLCLHVLNENSTNGFALTRPPGHHATTNRSMGFCLFNNAALAAHAMTKKGKKVLIIDPDVHHGNGVQQLFFNRNDVLYQSLHLSPHYPGTGEIQEIGIGQGEGYTNNAPLSHGNGNTAATQILQTVFLPIAHQFHPDLIIMCTGYDSHHADPLGGLQFTTQFYADITKMYQKIQPKLVCTLEGGYNLEKIGSCFLAQLAQLSNQPFSTQDTTHEINTADTVITQLKKELGDYWDL